MRKYRREDCTFPKLGTNIYYIQIFRGECILRHTRHFISTVLNSLPVILKWHPTNSFRRKFFLSFFLSFHDQNTILYLSAWRSWRQLDSHSDLAINLIFHTKRYMVDCIICTFSWVYGTERRIERRKDFQTVEY